MSQWTHVAGTIRLDALFNRDERLVKKILGPTCDYCSKAEAWKLTEDSDTPCGSEGSLQHAFFPYPEPVSEDGYESNSVMWGSCVLWADLRDYEDVEAIEKWFTRVIGDFAENHILVRDAVLKIDVEYRPSQILTVFRDENHKMQIQRSEGPRNT